MKTAPRFAVVAKVLVRPAIWFCASNLLVAALAAQCVNVAQVPDQTISSGAPCYSNNGTLTATGVTINGSASVEFVAGQSIHLGAGFRARGTDPGAMPTTFHAWVETLPSVSVSPSGGSGWNQVFTVTASSPSGYADLTEMQLLLNTTRTGTDGCYIRYLGNLLYLADNSGTVWQGGFAPGSAGVASNSYCSISGTGASVTGSGTQLSVSVPVDFQTPFAGAKNQYVIAYNNRGLTSEWREMGTWTVPGTPVGTDFSLSTAQNTLYVPVGYSNPTFNITVTPLNGFTSPVSFSVVPFTMCGTPVFSPALVSGPPWATTLSMSCTQLEFPRSWWATVYASGGGKSHELYLYLTVTQGQQYYLTTAVNPAGAGTLTLSPPGGWYTFGTHVAVTATPGAGYWFTSFTGVDSSIGATGYVTMNSNRSVTANFTLGSQVAAPSFSPAGGTYSTTQSVAITTTTGGASIRYTMDGSIPTSTTGTLYAGPLSVSSTTTVKAIAYKLGMADSIVSTATYTITLVVAAPTFNPAAGTYSSTQNVAITTSTTDATIRYTTDGTNPTSSTGTVYTGPVPVASTTTIKAIAYKPGMTDSTFNSATYTITLGVVAAPSFTPAGGTYSSAQNVAITCTTTGATIRYTTDGTNPTPTSGAVYTGPVPVSTSTTIKAIAYTSGITDSPITSASYVIQGSTSTRREYIRFGGRVIAIENVP